MKLLDAARATRVLACLVCVSLLAIPLLTAPASAQVAGRNVNMVTGGTFPGGDPYLAKQNELSLAMSTRNPCHLLGSANDYRAVFLPGLPSDFETGDSWPGWYESADCGSTWYSTLIPGYLQDDSKEGKSSPANGYSTGADPYVRAGAAGTFYTSFIVFNRGTTSSKLVVARFIDHNNFDTFIDPDKIPNVSQRRARSPFAYVGTTEVARRTSVEHHDDPKDHNHHEGEHDAQHTQTFIDKPSQAVFPAATNDTCSMHGETVPATNVYVAWTEFPEVGGNESSTLFFARSTNCALTFSPRVELSTGRLSQGTQIAVNPTNPMDIVVVWRQIRNQNLDPPADKDAIMFVRSTDGGLTFSKPPQAVGGLGPGDYKPFDQNTTSTKRGNSTITFRTLGYPAIVFADDGHLYLAVSQVPDPGNTGLGGANARVAMTRMEAASGAWAPLTPVVDVGAAGQQFMPALAYAAGKLQLIWYDVRYDEAAQEANAEAYGARFIDDAATLLDPAVKKRRTIDVLGAQASLPLATWPPTFSLYGVSQPDYNNPPSPAGPPVLRGPRISQYQIGDRNPPVEADAREDGGARQLLFNRGGLEIYGGGSMPFMSDYIDIMGIPFVFNPTSEKWEFNGLGNSGNTALQTFQAGWTDNRDVKIGKATTSVVSTPQGPVTVLNYTAPASLPGNATLATAPDNCPVIDGQAVDNTQTRDANVYTSRITNDFSLTLPANARRTNTPGVIRTFALQLANNKELTPGATTAEIPTRFRLTLSDPGNTSTPASSSFSRHTFAVSGSSCEQVGGAPVDAIEVDILPRSSIARTVFVRCSSSQGSPIVVTATKIEGGVDVASASVVINGDPTSPPARDGSGNLLGPETHNPDAENPDAENPDGENPDAENPDGENPDAENPDGENPDAENPDAENPDAENPDGENPDAENPDAENAAFQDVSIDVTNKGGNTTSGYQVQIQANEDTSDYKFLLTARRVVARPASINCYLVRERRNQMLFSIPLSEGDLFPDHFFEENDESVKHATFIARPGESIRVSARIVWNSEERGPFCSPDPDAANYCFKKLSFRVVAQAPNTGEDEPRDDAEGAFSDLVIDGTLVAPPVAGSRGIVDVPARTITNAGNADADPSESEASSFFWSYYLSTDRTLSADCCDDFQLGTEGEHEGSLAPGAAVPVPAQRLTIPTPEGILTGPHFLGILADTSNDVVEGREFNNALVTTTPIDLKPHNASITTPVDGALSGPYSVTVTVRDSPFEGNPVAGASVTLSLEGPNAVDEIPGPVNKAFQAKNGTTNASGQVTFNFNSGLPPGNDYRFIAAVRIKGVTPGSSSMNFQSDVFDVSPTIVIGSAPSAGQGFDLAFSTLRFAMNSP